MALAHEVGGWRYAIDDEMDQPPQFLTFGTRDLVSTRHTTMVHLGIQRSRFKWLPK